jgi:hypothetical protein
LEVNEEVDNLLDEATGAESEGREGRLIKMKAGEYAVFVK